MLSRIWRRVPIEGLILLRSIKHGAVGQAGFFGELPLGQAVALARGLQFCADILCGFGVHISSAGSYRCCGHQASASP